MREALERLEREQFACAHHAHVRVQTWQKEHRWKWHEVTLSTEEERYVLPRPQRGRPKVNEVREEGTRFRVIPHTKEKEALISEQKKQCSLFVLITSHQDEQTCSNRRVLETYEGQDAAETRFRLLKSPAMINAVYIKDLKRIEALGTVLVIALMVYGVLEWRVRERLKEEKEPLILPGKRKSFRPTGEMLLALQLLQTIKTTMFCFSDGRVERRSTGQLSENVKRVIELAGYDVSIYVQRSVSDSVEKRG